MTRAILTKLKPSIPYDLLSVLRLKPTNSRLTYYLGIDNMCFIRYTVDEVELTKQIGDRPMGTGTYSNNHEAVIIKGYESHTSASDRARGVQYTDSRIIDIVRFANSDKDCMFLLASQRAQPGNRYMQARAFMAYAQARYNQTFGRTYSVTAETGAMFYFFDSIYSKVIQ